MATSANHSELITFHEATREAVWLRNMHKIIMEHCGLAQDNKPTIIIEDNVACGAQVGVGFIKTDDWVKHVYLKYLDSVMTSCRVGRLR